MSDRLASPLLPEPFQSCRLIVDCTPVFIERPKDADRQREFYSGKFKRHCAKYECAVRPSNGLFCWTSAMYAGPCHDIIVLHNSGLLDALGPGECLMGDKGYISGDLQHVLFTPYKGRNLTPQQAEYNVALQEFRVVVEHSFGHLKQWGCLAGEWRSSLEKLDVVFVVCVCITNMKTKRV